MRILVKNDNGKLRRALRLLVAHQARRTLRGLRALLPRVSVSLAEMSDPAGGLDKRCTVTMKAAGAGSVTLSALAKNWQTAIKLALRGAAERLRALWLERSATRPALEAPERR